MTDFAYIGKLEVNHANCQELLEAATKTAFTDVIDGCVGFVTESIDRNYLISG